ncbi:hypothetical protein ACFQT0_06180 [Hymenobacter humi]|uniref:AraC family transcriptional regulator n=1 Tax=Hymenobacter humi TaxID=1411620 RepID=A0ABW2U2J3_9BACT
MNEQVALSNHDPAFEEPKVGVANDTRTILTLVVGYADLRFNEGNHPSSTWQLSIPSFATLTFG